MSQLIVRSTTHRTLPTPLPLLTSQGRGIPLAGDLVAALTEKVGADRLARWVSDKLGKPCGCAARREKLNRLDATVRKYLGWESV